MIVTGRTKTVISWLIYKIYRSLIHQKITYFQGLWRMWDITRIYTRCSRYRRWQRQDFRILDGISKDLIIDLNNNEKQTLWDEDIGPFQRRRTYRVETIGQDAILSYWFNTRPNEIASGLVGRCCGGAPCSSSPTPCWIHQIAGTSVSFLLM